MLNPEQINRARDIIGSYDKSAVLVAVATEGHRAICLLRELLAATEAAGQAEQETWTRVTTELPPLDEGVRVLVYTEGVDFAGEQYFDIPADHLHYAASGNELGKASEVAEAASHWKLRPHD